MSVLHLPSSIISRSCSLRTVPPFHASPKLQHVTQCHACCDLQPSRAARQQLSRSLIPLSAAAAAAQRQLQCRSNNQSTEPMPAPAVVVEGDVVTFHMTCKDEEGNVLESTKDASKDNEPMCFEIGAGDIVSNPLFQAFDGSLRGLGVGESIELQISGGEWQKDLLFIVPRDHPEVERLENRYKNHGGLAEGLAVELANRSMAVVVEVTPEHVKLDANSMMAGKTLLFELEVLKIESNSA